MFLPEGVRRRVQVSATPESGGESTFETYSRTDDESSATAAWNMHATGSLVHESKCGDQATDKQDDRPGRGAGSRGDDSLAGRVL